MLASPVPIYLGCAGLIVGSLGLGAQYMLGGNSAPATNVGSEQPLFARSVEEASLPASHWWSQQPNVAYYEPMVKLLTTPSRSVPPAPVTPQARPPEAHAPQVHAPQVHAPEANPPVASRDAPAPAPAIAQQPSRAAPREIVRDVPRETRPAKRIRNARARDEATASTEQVDPRDAYAKADRDVRRSERRYRGRGDSEFTDTRSRFDRRQVEIEDDRPRRGERRVTVQEEPAPRIVRGPEQHDGGFSPFRLFGIFER